MHRARVFAATLALTLASSVSADADADEPPAPSATSAPVAPSAPAAPPEGPSPDAALEMLKTGNDAFVTGTSQRPHQDGAWRSEIAGGQKPFATVLSCSDSRVPVELAFDRGFGDLFVIRVAGNVADTDELGTIEYGVDHLGTPVLVVLGHTQCGAVTAVATGAEVHGHILKLVDNIAPAVESVKLEMPGVDAKELVEPAIRANVLQAMADVMEKSNAVRERLSAGEVRVVGGVYHLEDGKVEWLGEHPKQAALLAKAPADAGHGEEAHPEGPGAEHGDEAGAHADAPHGPSNLPAIFGALVFVVALAGAITGRLTARS